MSPTYVLPHERSFGGLLVLLAVLALVQAGPTALDGWVFAVLATVALVSFRSTRGRGEIVALRWRLAFYPVAMNVVYQQLRTAVPAIHPVNQDHLLEFLDGVLLGTTPSLVLERAITPWLTEVMSFCYILFMPYLLFSILYYLFAPPEQAIRFHVGLFTLYACGFLGYLLVPAAGPWIAMADQFTVPLEGGWITSMNATMVMEGSNRVDVFPSLHCAVSTFLLVFDWRFKRWRFWAYLLPCVGLWGSTLYLRYHYLMDVLTGFLLAALCLWMALSPKLRWKD